MSGATKATGLDRRHNYPLRKAAHGPKAIALHCLRAMAELGRHGDEWEMWKLTLLHKPGRDPTQLNAYRPITVLSHVYALACAMLQEEYKRYLDAVRTETNKCAGNSWS